MKLWNSMVFPRKLSTNCWVSTSMLIRRPLPSLSLGGAAPGITEGVRHGPVPALCFAMMVPPEAPQAVSIGLRNCYVARFQLPPQAPQAVSIELRNCYVARFEQALEASKAPQQLSKAFEPQNIPQQLAKASRLLCHGTSRGPTSGFYWASKLLRGTFSATSPGPTSCFSWASKLLRGTFWAPLKSLKSFKSPAAAFEGLWTAKPSAAACEGVPPALPWGLPRPLPWDLPRPHKLFLLGFETATWPP